VEFPKFPLQTTQIRAVLVWWVIKVIKNIIIILGGEGGGRTNSSVVPGKLITSL